jgi:hypothetical protein
MLPDFPKAKNFIHARLLRELRAQLPLHEPLLRGMTRSVVHEGRTTRLTRSDESTSQVNFVKTSLQIDVSREEMKGSTLEGVANHISRMSGQLAESQVKAMLETVSNAAHEVGNAVSSHEIGEKEAFLEMERRLQVDFDPETKQPLNRAIVMGPAQFERLKELSKEWEKDPIFVEELKRIRHHQFEAWLDRENRRKLAD